MPTHKKGHDKDKYYHMAKDQGYRSRAAFKLIQINKRFDLFAKARVVIDLCAAPGGWCQVAAKCVPPGSLVLGVDLLPIRAIRNVKTFVQDITTAECRKLIASELQTWKADVVLCDGAPNIGTAYNKDAYVQNELVLAALKTATDHLVAGGSFCTKVYRSTDYNALMWVFQQLFEDVQAMKPNSSRSQSSEIFIICLKYTAPRSIDPKLLDPNHVFKEVNDPGLQKVDVLHKKYEKLNKRHRTGYEDGVGIVLRSKATVSEFLLSKDPVRLLTDRNEIVFQADDELDEQAALHQFTTPEVRQCLSDLRVLAKLDFKKLLKWRDIMRANFVKSGKDGESGTGDDAEAEAKRAARHQGRPEVDLEEELMRLSSGVGAEERREKKKLRQKAMKERQRQALGMNNNAFDAAEDSELFALGDGLRSADLDELNDVDLGVTDEDDEEDGALDGNGHARNRRVLSEYYRQKEAESQPSLEPGAAIFLPGDGPDGLDGSELLDEELEEQYQRFATGRRMASEASLSEEALLKRDRQQEAAPSLEDRTLSAKAARLARSSDAILGSRAKEDGLAAAALSGELASYVKMLSGGQVGEASTNKKRKRRDGDDRDNVDDDDDDDDDNSDEDGDAMDDGDADGSKRDGPMVVSRSTRLTGRALSDKWFAHPIFGESVLDAEDGDSEGGGGGGRNGVHGDDALWPASGRLSRAAREAIAQMPKTDKEKRQEERRKAKEKQERRQQRRAGVTDEDSAEAAMGIEIAPRSSASEAHFLRGGDDDGADDDEGEGLTAEVLRHRDLIRRGLGASLLDGGSNSKGVKKMKKAAAVVASSSSSAATASSGKQRGAPTEQEQDADKEKDGAVQVVARSMLPEVPLADDREYDSDHEQYDAHDRAVTLALGTLMLRRSKQKALVDASYNRFSWNDPKALPSWFVDDELKHNKPQLPVPDALLSQIKSRFQLTGTKEIKKVAEARARKRKRAMTKLKAAKKQASAMVENSELSEKQKLKAVQKAMRVSKVDQPGKVYVVTHRSGNASSGTPSAGKGKLKFVDKRMKKDSRAVKANGKKAKKGSKKGKK